MSGRIRTSVQALHAYVPGEQPADPRVVKLNTNENPYPPSPRVLAAIRDAEARALRRYPDPVCRRPREAIAALHGCGVDQVVVGNGSDEVLALCTRAFVEDSGVVGYFDPSYSLYPVLADIRAVARQPVALDADFGWPAAAGPCLGLPEPGAGSIFFLTNPNAPTALAFPRDRIERFCRAFGGVVVIDEAYVDFADGDCVDLALHLPNVLVCRTLSKSYSLAGVRAGYAVGPAALIEALGRVKDSYNVNALTQAAITAAIEDQPHMRANAERIRATRAALTADLHRRGFEVPDSQTNFLWARPPAPLTARACFEALRGRGVYVRHFAAPATAAHIRISIGTAEETAMFLQALDAVLGAPVRDGGPA